MRYAAGESPCCARDVPADRAILEFLDAPMTNRGPGIYYADYLQLDRLLSCQSPEGARIGRPAHDEMLFIVVHQAYEL